MNIVGFVVSLVAALFAIIGLVPFLGWLNWFTTIPLGLIGAGFSAFSLSARKNSLAMAGLIISVVSLIVAFIRLWIGCGVI